ncbi:hypothetical protein EK21DRAFT_111447 [Setomelanomma holmii]|uniref:Uncharacterized protein n=1 Tax=Setomelanomma holmii TaxID=210430 RepID=A0A9P4HC53_9PLEO|nr:hypothetical protein EK21DRAFT_111447 [Setomelanomma holmii]
MLNGLEIELESAGLGVGIDTPEELLPLEELSEVGVLPESDERLEVDNAEEPDEPIETDAPTELKELTLLVEGMIEDNDVPSRLLEDDEAFTGSKSVLNKLKELVGGMLLFAALEVLNEDRIRELVILLDVTLSVLEDVVIGGMPGEELTVAVEVVALNELFVRMNVVVIEDRVEDELSSSGPLVPFEEIITKLGVDPGHNDGVPGLAAGVPEVGKGGALLDLGKDEPIDDEAGSGEPGVLGSDELEDTGRVSQIVVCSVVVVVFPDVTLVDVLVTTDGTAVAPGLLESEEGLGSEIVNPSLCVGVGVIQDLLEDVEGGEGLPGDGETTRIVDVTVEVVTCPPGIVLVSVIKMLDVTEGAGLGGAAGADESMIVTEILVRVVVPPPRIVLVIVVKALEVEGGARTGGIPAEVGVIVVTRVVVTLEVDPPGLTLVGVVRALEVVGTTGWPIDIGTLITVVDVLVKTVVAPPGSELVIITRTSEVEG